MAVARAHPGLSVHDHIERSAAELGAPAARSILERLIDRALEVLIDGPLHWLAGDVTVVFHDVIAGRTFTHRLGDIEREMQVLTVSFDLAAYGRFDRVLLADGSELEVSADRGHLAWRGPDGWLAGFQPGDLLAFTATFDPPAGDEPVDATVTIDVLADEPTVTTALAEEVRAAYDRERHEHGLSVAAEDLVLSLCWSRPELFTEPLPPVADWCSAAGLEIRGNLVAHDDSVWRRDRMIRLLREVAERVDDPDERRVLGRAVGVLPDPEATVEEVRTSLAECAEPEALDVLAELLLPQYLAPEDEFDLDGVDAPGHAFELVHRAIAVARRPREVATAEYLACVLEERCGRPRRAAEHLGRAVAAQPRLGPVVERMGQYCFDRGDARGAMRWWRELDEVHPGASTLTPFLNPSSAHPKLGRNDPCWCGSGRKFKRCHQTVSELPALPDRVGWLYRKASLWLEQSSGDTRELVTDLVIAWVAGDPDAQASDVLVDDDAEMQARFANAVADPIVFDAALHEGRGFARFLHERGELLPDDEQLLASSWTTADRSVHEVVAVERGVGLTLRNLATGDVVDVRERRLSGAAHEGERWCARVVPDGAAHQIIGGAFPVRTGHEERVLDLCADGDPLELCAWAGALARPPRIEHRPGLLDSMIDRDAVEAALADLDGADEAAVLERLNEEISRQFQAHWLDERIPALDGLTPREAAADPTRREQLERLLDEWDRMEERMQRETTDDDQVGLPFTSDVSALRRELGLS